MIHFVPKEGVKERFRSWFLAAAMRLDRYKYRIDLRQLLGIVEVHHPSAIRFIVHVENPQIQGQRPLSLGRLLLAPYLECIGIDEPTLSVEVERIENERLALRIKDPAKRFLRAAAAINIEKTFWPGLLYAGQEETF